MYLDCDMDFLLSVRLIAVEDLKINRFYLVQQLGLQLKHFITTGATRKKFRGNQPIRLWQLKRLAFENVFYYTSLEGNTNNFFLSIEK